MKFAVQLYSLRGLIQSGEDLLNILPKVKELGFEGVEFAGYFGLDASTLRAKLDEVGLVAVGTHIGISDFEEDTIAQTLAFCKTLGLRYAGVGGAPHATVEEAENTARILGRASEIAEKEGIKIYYHNHSEEFKDIGGVYAIDIIKKSVALELDTYWSFYAGVDNYKFIQENADKIALFHIKDGRDGTPCALGEGQNDLAAVFRAVKEIGTQWLILENDDPVPDGISDVTRSMKVLKANF